MTRVTRWIRRHGTSCVATACLLAASIGVAVTTPGDRVTQAPFLVTGAVGDRLVGRDLTAQVHGITETETLTATDGIQSYPVATAGEWVLVDASVAAVRKATGSLQNARLKVGADTYAASVRLGANAGLLGAALSPGVPIRGLLAFELPKSAAHARDARLHVARAIDDRLDSEIVVRLDLGQAAHQPSVAVDRPAIR